MPVGMMSWRKLKLITNLRSGFIRLIFFVDYNIVLIKNKINNLSNGYTFTWTAAGIEPAVLA